MGIENTTRGIRYTGEVKKSPQQLRRNPLPGVKPPDRGSLYFNRRPGERAVLRPLVGVKPPDRSILRPLERRIPEQPARVPTKNGTTTQKEYFDKVREFKKTPLNGIKKDQLAPETDEEIIKAYGIDFVTKDSWYLHLIVKALIVYPRDFFVNNGVRDVHFTSLWRENANGDYDEKTGVIRIETDPDNLRKDSVFHHEVYHRLDLGTSKGKEFRKEWEEKFPRGSVLKLLLFKVLKREIPNFQKYIGNRYKTGGEFDRIWGFASRYGQHSPKEDRATVAEMILSEPERLNSLLKTEDVTLKGKVQYMMSFYNKMSRGKMDSVFWADYAMGKVDSNYWRTRR